MKKKFFFFFSSRFFIYYLLLLLFSLYMKKKCNGYASDDNANSIRNWQEKLSRFLLRDKKKTYNNFCFVLQTRDNIRYNKMTERQFLRKQITKIARLLQAHLTLAMSELLHRCIRVITIWERKKSYYILWGWLNHKIKTLRSLWGKMWIKHRTNVVDELIKK